MPRYRVKVEQDHLERLVKKPIAGISELVWNAVDADATTVSIDVEENRLDGVDAVVVADNGTGINAMQAEMYFSHLGGSWKANAIATEGGRSIHGRNGQGRWAAYGAGEHITWRSVADQVTGERAEITIKGRRGDLGEFDVSEPRDAAGRPTGTVVRVEGPSRDAQQVLLRDEVRDGLTSTFALYLEQYHVTVTWRGQALDPAAIQNRRYTTDLHVEGVDDAIELVVIEWNRPQPRALHFCDASGASLFDTPPAIHARGFDFTAYLRWPGFRDYLSELALADLGHAPLNDILDAARDELRRYFKSRAKDRGQQLLADWKSDRTYPFELEPTTVVDRIERDLFDIVAVTAAPAVEQADPNTRKLSLRLLREAIERSPGSVHEILQEVLDLPAEKVEELRTLLQRTTLTSMIAATRQITDRLDFLVGLEAMVFDKDWRKRILERQQLHRILATETWIFREEYALTGDDVTLKTALRDHIHLLGRDDLTPDDTEAEVLAEHGERVVIDMMLSRVIEQRHDHREHVVIELKRPTVHVGMDQVAQIQKYAQAVARDSRFARTDTRWEFWIVGDQLDDTVSMMAKQRGRDPGIIVDAEDLNLVVRAVTWAQVIGDARHRLRFVKDALDYTTSTDAGIAYLKEQHGKYLPEEPDLEDEAVGD